MEMLNLILIDPDNQTVTVVETTGSLAECYRLMNCQLIDIICRQTNGDALTVDDEGTLKENNSRGFYFNGEGPFVGKTLVAGVDREGDTANPAYTLEDVCRLVEWEDNVAFDSQIEVFGWN